MNIFKKFTPGGTIADALAVVQRYNDDGIVCSVSHLAVLKNDPSAVAAEVEIYLELLENIQRFGLESDVTLKLHQLGVYGAVGLAGASVQRIAKEAHSSNNFVWIDMERQPTIDTTLDLCRALHHTFPGTVGICLQAYLTRSKRDMQSLVGSGIPIRLVKGFYNDADITSWHDVTVNFRQLMTSLFDTSSFTAIASHDLAIVAEAKEYVLQHNLKQTVEFQFFQGVRDDLARDLMREGFRVRIYVPFGDLTRFIVQGFRTFDVWHQFQRTLGFTPWP